MTLYLLKSAACLAILFFFYKLVLEHTALHTIKRIYLLISTLCAFAIPFITFTQYVEITPLVQTWTEVPTSTLPMSDAVVFEPAPIDYTPIILWSLYLLGVLIFSIRFVRNLLSMTQKIRRNPTIKTKSIFYVLLHLPVTPHSFFNYIFFNKTAFETNSIPEEVMIHEQAHVRQKHSWDLLFMEVLRIVFWFNPLLYFVKNSIRLNHEFLADRAVLESGTDTSAYQNIILDFSSTSSVPAMAHSINYSSFKKRFTVMKTHTSKRAAWLKSLIVLPLLAVLIYGFSTTEVVEKVAINSTLETSENRNAPLTARSISIHILDDVSMEVDEVEIHRENLQEFLMSLHTDITKLQRDRTMNFHVTSEAYITYSDLVFIQSVVSNYGYHRIVTPREEIIRSKNNTPMLPETNGDGATSTQLEVYNQLAKKHNAQPEESRTIGLNELKTLETIYRLMTSKQKESAQPFPKCAPKNKIASQQDYASEYLSGATQNDKKAFVLQIELSEIKLNGIPTRLDKLAERLDAYTKTWEETDYTAAYPSILIAATPRSYIEKVDAEFKKTHYSKANAGMSLIAPGSERAQKKATAAQIAEYNKLASKYNSMSKDNMRIKGKELTRMRYIYDLMTVEQRKKAEPFPNIPPPPPAPSAPIVKIGEISNIPPPPAPPTPPNPLDHVIQMAKKGANFYYEGKSISSDKAIELLKKNKGLNIQIRDHKKPYEVRISKEPIQMQKQTAASSFPKIKVKTNNVELETGNIKINGEEHFYSRKNGTTYYFNKAGKAVNIKGQVISSSNNSNPDFYYNGKKISAAKAHRLLDSNSSIVMTSETNENGTYSVVLNDINKPSNPNSQNVNYNNNNPNSVIDLTEVIAKGAQFYLNDEKISTEKARYLTEKTNNVARVNVIEKKDKTPMVYFWTN